MTNKEMRKDIERSARAEENAGTTIEIDYRLPFVHIEYEDGKEYYFQGQEASELLETHERAASKFGVSVTDSILHSAQGW